MESIFSRCLLFEGIPDDALPGLLQSLGGHESRCDAKSLLLRMEEPVREMGILLEGSAQALIYTPDGRELLLTRLAPADLFADVLAMGREAESPVTIEALEDCRVLWLPTQRLLEGATGCPEERRLLQNLTGILSEKYFSMQRRLLCLTQKSLREKIRFYLSQERAAHRSASFQIPFDRTELAHYLGAERSALCRELSRMKRDGLIECQKNHFTILTKC